MIVSIVEDSARLDESKLRSLGVRAILKKPFGSEQLLQTINGILNSPAGKPDGARPGKSRQWPPLSTVTGGREEDSRHPAASIQADHQDQTDQQEWKQESSAD